MEKTYSLFTGLGLVGFGLHKKQPWLFFGGLALVVAAIVI